MKSLFISFLIILLLFCSCESNTSDEDQFESISTEVTTLFDEESFESQEMLDLLIELKICNPSSEDSIIEGIVPCTPKFFAFYGYNHKRNIEDAFLLQVRKGVNEFPYRRLLIFTRERGELIKMNGIVGYLVEKRSRPNEIDDLVVAVVDNIGGKYERYDVLLRYNDGKYHFVEAIGDLEGTFQDEALKEKASKMIKQRIEEKQLIF